MARRSIVQWNPRQRRPVTGETARRPTPRTGTTPRMPRLHPCLAFGGDRHKKGRRSRGGRPCLSSAPRRASALGQRVPRKVRYVELRHPAVQRDLERLQRVDPAADRSAPEIDPDQIVRALRRDPRLPEANAQTSRDLELKPARRELHTRVPPARYHHHDPNRPVQRTGRDRQTDRPHLQIPAFRTDQSGRTPIPPDFPPLHDRERRADHARDLRLFHRRRQGRVRIGTRRHHDGNDGNQPHPERPQAFHDPILELKGKRRPTRRAVAPDAIFVPMLAQHTTGVAADGQRRPHDLSTERTP